MYYDAIDLLKGMISRPSFSREEGETADFLKQSWEKAGYKVNRKGNNLWLIAPGFDLDKPTLLLNSHIDTVQAGFGLDRKIRSIRRRRKTSVCTALAAMMPARA